jgi:hypothetical protein
VTNDRLVYELGFPEGTSKKEIARHEALALESLVAAGKIRDADLTGGLYCEFHH